MTIKTPTASEKDRIRQIHLEAFEDIENQMVANLASELLDTISNPETLHLVAEIDAVLVGHVVFSPARSRVGGSFVGYILAPLAVSPEEQGKGIGSALVNQGLQHMLAQNVDIVFVYGDPKYYARFGFTADLAEKYVPPFTLKYPSGWQALDLSEKNAVGGSVELECVSPLSKPELW